MGVMGVESGITVEVTASFMGIKPGLTVDIVSVNEIARSSSPPTS